MNIKGMDEDMRCREFQFEIGKEYKIDTKGKQLELCSGTVFHYCKSLQQVHKFYNCKEETNRFFEIEVLGEEVSDNEKCGSNHIKILREIVGEELAAMKGLINGNGGLFNSGNWNSGDWNSGNRNSGNWNSGDWNSGNWNSGNRNSGYWNSGDWNSGNRNSGYWNSGYWNSGNCNSGNCNSGDCNSGDCNLGNYNSGYGNKCNGSNGVFCTEEDMDIRIFNKPSGMSLKQFYKSNYYTAMRSAQFKLTEWVKYTKEEQEADPKKETTRGYLKTYTMEEAWENWWNRLTDKNKKIIMQIPNFDPKIFKEITGIDVKGETNEHQ